MTTYASRASFPNQTGLTGDYVVPFPYIVQAHVKVYLIPSGGTFASAIPQAAGLHYNWTSPSVIHFAVAPSGGVQVEIRRDTPITDLLLNAPSVIRAEDINKVSTRLLYLIQEAEDAALEQEQLKNATIRVKQGQVVAEGDLPGLLNKALGINGAGQLIGLNPATATPGDASGISYNGGNLATFLAALTEFNTNTLPGADATQYLVGQEYLSGMRKRITQGLGCSHVMSGDSRIAGTAVALGYIPDVLLASQAKDHGADFQVFYSRGQPGKRSDDWLNTYLAGDLTAAAGTPGNHLILHWMHNDPDTAIAGGPLSVAQSMANLVAGLMYIRGLYPLSQLNITIMGPGSAIGRGRTAAYFKAVNVAMRAIARLYKCAYFDTFNFARDCLENIGLGWDDVFGDGSGAVHPLDPMNGLIWYAMADFMFRGLGPMKANHFWNRANTSAFTLTAATLPAAFDYGIFSDHVLAASGFPVDGYLVTIKNKFAATNGTQFLTGYDGTRGIPIFMWRFGGSFWTSWFTMPMKFNGSTTYDAPSLVDGAGATSTVPVTGAIMGDFAQVSFGVDLQGMTVNAWVSAANTVSFRIQNETGGTIDLASTTVRAMATAP